MRAHIHPHAAHPAKTRHAGSAARVPTRDDLQPRRRARSPRLPGTPCPASASAITTSGRRPHPAPSRPRARGEQGIDDLAAPARADKRHRVRASLLARVTGAGLKGVSRWW
ncbi:hypothetical protein Shyhy01_67270 [Streptomyces hygroscopicus subsp. hygroscopicus]|nr:hypothetical protein Shyhy01_67270 [Streptomyces hygroscopicus subsp. hygroscopicus]